MIKFFNSFFNELSVFFNINAKSSKREILLDSMKEENSGVYKIIAKNDVGFDEAKWFVNVEGITKIYF